MTQTTAAADARQPGEPLWQPMRDEPLFPGELLAGPAGLDALDAHTVGQIRRYLAAVVAARGFPLHVNVMWNALHYGYDLISAGYHEGVLRVDAFATLTADRAALLPVGAMVTMPSTTPVWTEIVHAELEDTAFDTDGDLPAVHSGAPEPPGAAVRLIGDPKAFGRLLPEQHSTLRRLTGKGVLDRHGHAVTTVPDGNSHLFAATSAERYARWLVQDGAERLAGGPVPEALPGADEDTLTTGVVASLAALTTLLAGMPEVKLVGEYAIPARGLSCLATGDLDDLVSGMCRADRRAIRYTGAGVTLRALPADRNLAGVRYLTGLVELSGELRRRALADRDDPGRQPNGVHLRLDDAHRGGGVWRAAGAAAVDGDRRASPLVPLGLGFALRRVPADTNELARWPGPPPEDSSTPEQEIPEAPVSHDGVIAPRDADRGNGLIGDLDIGASHISFTVALRVRHIAEEVLPVPASAVQQLAQVAAPLAVRIAHAGVDLADDEVFHEPVSLRQGSPAQLSGIAYPLDFHPGLLLTATITLGGRVIDVGTERLPDPVDFAGRTITHATDLAVLAAFCGLSAPDPGSAARASGERLRFDLDGPLDGESAAWPGAGRRAADHVCGDGAPVGDGDAQTGGSPASEHDQAYLALLLRTVLRAVPVEPEGTRTFTAAALVATAYAGLAAPVDAVGRAGRLLDGCANRGRLLRLAGLDRYLGTREGFVADPPSYVWWPPGSAAPVHRMRRPAPTAVRGSQIPVSLRKLPPGWSPSPDKLASWSAIRSGLGQSYLPRDLPPGYTWVEAHERGSDPGWRSGAVRGSFR